MSHANEGAPSSSQQKNDKSETLWDNLSRILKGKNGASARDALEEYVENNEDEHQDSASSQEKAILSNILRLRDVKVYDVMVPRADIVAIDATSSQEDLLGILADKQYSRIPVFKGTMDDILGTIHVKDVLATMAKGEPLKIKKLVKAMPVVSPSMDVFDLILDMRQRRRHMALVVDEYGGVDGLITISDVIEEIVGDINDEHDLDDDPEMITDDNGAVVADARVYIEDFEEEHGTILSEEEREESDTLGGLVCDIAGRVPARGEILTHDSGTMFEILDADPRRVSRIKIYNIPEQ